MTAALHSTLLALAISFAAFCQPASYNISTVAGVGNGDGGPAAAALLAAPQGLAFDGAGNFYIADPSDHRVRKIGIDGTITTFAGIGGNGAFSGDGGQAAAAQLNGPSAVAADKSGAIYIADTFNNRIRKVTPDGKIQTVAGPGVSGVIGDGGPATSARVNSPWGVAVDASGNLFISEIGNDRVRIVVNGIIHTIAGNNGVGAGLSGDGGQAVKALLNGPTALTVDAQGNLYIDDAGNYRIRKITPGKASDVATSYQIGIISTIASGSTALLSPQGVAVDAAGNLYIADAGSNQIREVTAAGKVVIFAGSGAAGFSGDGGAAATALLDSPGGVAADSAGNVFIADSGNGRIRKIAANTVSTIAGTASVGDGGPATAALLGAPWGMAFDGAGNLYVADLNAHRVRKIATDGTISTAAGTGVAGFSGDGGPATAAQLSGPSAVAVDKSGNIYIADTYNNRIRKITGDGVIQTAAGPGVSGVIGNDGPATSARINTPYGVAVDSAGNIFISEYGNARIRIVVNGIIDSIVNTPNAGAGFSGDGAFAAAARLRNPTALAVDSKGNLYIVDTGNYRIRKVTPTADSNVGTAYAGGTISTIASDIYSLGVAVDAAGNVFIDDTGGNGVVELVAGSSVSIAGSQAPGFSGDGGPATSALLNGPRGVAVDSAGNIFVADFGNGRIRKLTLQPTPASLGLYTTSTLVGTQSTSGVQGAKIAFVNLGCLALDKAGNLYFGDMNGAYRATSAAGPITKLVGPSTPLPSHPYGCAVDNQGNFYIADLENGTVREVSATGAVSTIAGTPGQSGYSGDGGPAAAALLNHPYGVAVDGAGDMYIADTGNGVIRKVTADGVIRTINSGGSGGNLAVDRTGNLYVALSGGCLVRKISPAGVVSTFAGAPQKCGFAGDGGPASSALLNAPFGLALDGVGNLYIGERTGNRIRKVDVNGIITTVAGSGVVGFGGDGGSSLTAELNTPIGVAADAAGNVYVADSLNGQIRKFTPPPLYLTGAVNAASLLPGPIAPGEIVVINGNGLGSSGTQVLFDGTPAPQISVQANQVSAIVPYEVAGQAATSLQIQINGAASNSISIPVTTAAPAIFTQDSSGAGQALAFNSDSTPNSASNPASAGSTITFNATGVGQTGLPSVQIGGIDAAVVSAGTTSDPATGYFQVTIQIPSNAPTGGQVPIMLKVGGALSQTGVTIATQ